MPIFCNDWTFFLVSSFPLKFSIVSRKISRCIVAVVNHYAIARLVTDTKTPWTQIIITEELNEDVNNSKASDYLESYGERSAANRMSLRHFVGA